ncbi:hypothetical protein [Kitasatospora indigofera]|uniref:hypothetical protein n=1 Tax=Kitasatospora indigofera TaxID=67307 RepID=UPI0033A48D7C
MTWIELSDGSGADVDDIGELSYWRDEPRIRVRLSRSEHAALTSFAAGSVTLGIGAALVVGREHPGTAVFIWGVIGVVLLLLAVPWLPTIAQLRYTRRKVRRIGQLAGADVPHAPVAQNDRPL